MDIWYSSYICNADKSLKITYTCKRVASLLVKQDQQHKVHNLIEVIETEVPYQPLPTIPATCIKCSKPLGLTVKAHNFKWYVRIILSFDLNTVMFKITSLLLWSKHLTPYARNT